MFYKNSRKKSIAWVVLHIVAMVLVSVTVLSGFRIATLNHDWLFFLSSLLPQGEVHIFHIYSGVVLFCLLVTYMVFDSLHVAKKTPFVWFLFLSASSGMLLLFDTDMKNLLYIHYLFGIGSVLYITFHAFRYFIFDGIGVFAKILSVSKTTKKDITTLVFMLCISVLAVYTLKDYGYHKLYVKHIQKGIDVDGLLDEEAWSGAKALKIYGYGGANLDGGGSEITIKALTTDDDIFFSFTWRDPSKDISFMPIEKTKKGWKVVEDGFYNFDEKTYYEDKFAVILSHDNELSASRSTHMGEKPLKDKPQNFHSKGYHYTDSKIIDMWHWKALRTNEMKLLDDEFISSPFEVYTGKRRYCAGIMADPKTSGGYRMNWMWYKKDGIVPRRLPLHDSDLMALNEANLTLPYRANWYDYQAYSLPLDHYKVKTRIPSAIYVTNGIEGDRADVRAYATYKDGFWHLEVSRSLDTHSKYDVIIDNKTYIWVAVFDHAQIAHTRHSLPIKLVFGEGDE